MLDHRALITESLDRCALIYRYRRIRNTTNSICDPLSPEDMTVQAFEETSPTKWHLAHSTWFFETFILEAFDKEFKPFDRAFRVLYNSYYQAVGKRHPRPQRGMLTRPGLGEVMAYRDTTDERIEALLTNADEKTIQQITPLIELGLQHEQQHQELILMDIKRLLHLNPLQPAYNVEPEAQPSQRTSTPLDWIDVDGGIVEIGHENETQFAYDNESPRHRCFLEPFQLASRLVTNGEFLEFIRAGGYERPEFWLDEGWASVQTQRCKAPLYWQREEDDSYSEFTMNGRRPIDPDQPLVHISFFEADAFARFSEARLPTEVEWEHAASEDWHAHTELGTFLEDGAFHPRPPRTPDRSRFHQLAGDVWEWTRSAHEPYPGYAPPPGAIGEYNGKFMCGTYILRGGSCATPRDHIRPTYRNFFRPGAQWAFAGLRLARGGDPRSARTIPSSTQIVMPQNNTVRPTRYGPKQADTFEADVIAGLTKPNGEKAIPPKHLYDRQGSALFEAICTVDEYYVTRTEMALLEKRTPRIIEALGENVVLIEPGAGAGTKAAHLLAAMHNPSMFVPIEISESALDQCVTAIRAQLPDLAIQPINDSFLDGLKTLDGVPEQARVIYFPGSTIGNMIESDRIQVLTAFAKAAGPGGRVLIGYDRVKDTAVLEAAYDDANGVSAAFARNLISRINRELGATLDPNAFAYQAKWSAQHSRIEMHLISTTHQHTSINDQPIVIHQGERIHTEHSYKFTIERIKREAAQAGLQPVQFWSDEDEWFTIALFDVTATKA